MNLYPHHRPSGADKNDEPWPGMLSGGPNAGRQDDALKKLPQRLPPAKITWVIRLRMRAMRLRSIGKRRWCFASRGNQWKGPAETNDRLTA